MYQPDGNDRPPYLVYVFILLLILLLLLVPLYFLLVPTLSGSIYPSPPG
jgi:hypothetical protein